MTDDRLLALLEAHLEGRLTPVEADDLRAELRASPRARQRYWEYVEQHVLIEDILSESRGRDLALLEGGEPVAAERTASGDLPRRGRRWRAGLWSGAGAALAAGLLLALVVWWRPGADPAPIPAAPAVARVSSLVGQAEVTDLSGETVPAAVGCELYPGQALRVGDDSRAEVLFADGTQIALNPSATLRFSAPGSTAGRGFHLEHGAIQVQTAGQPPDHPLVVTTEHARITAGETRFRLYREEKASRVELEEGQVRLDSRDGGRSVELDGGLFVVATSEPAPMIPQPLPAGRCRLRHTLLRAGDAVSFSPDGARLVTSHWERGLRAWDTKDGALRSSAPGSRQLTHALAFTAAKDTVIALGNGGTAMLWKLGEPQPSQTRLRDRELRHGAVSDDARWLAQGSGTGEVALWEADPDKGSISLRQSLALKPSCVALSRNGSYAAVSRWAGEVHLFEVKEGREIAQYKLKRTPTPLALSADGRLVAAYANGDGLVLFDRENNSRRALWAGEGARVSHLHFAADGRVLLAGLEDGTVRAWSTEDGRLLLVLDTGHRHVNKVTATADLSLLATVGDSDCVKIWECQLP
jgi:ferric-dicitrate binding protein FerR (iron transport regulator)